MSGCREGTLEGKSECRISKSETNPNPEIQIQNEDGDTEQNLEEATPSHSKAKRALHFVSVIG
jgi:hypothetical protein